MMIRFILISIIFTYWLTPFYIKAVPEAIGWGVLHAFPLAYIVYSHKIVSRFYQNLHGNYWLYLSILMFLATFVLSLLTICYNNSNDYSFVNNLVLCIVTVSKYLFLLILSYKFNNNKPVIVNFMMFYSMAVAINAAFSIFTLLFPDLRLFWQDFIVQESRYIEDLDSVFISRYCISGFANSSVSVFASIGVALSLILLQNYNKLFIIAFILSSFGVIMYGRTGIILAVSAVLIIEFKKLSFQNIKKLLKYSLLSMCLFWGAWNWFDDPVYDAWKDWIFEPVVAFSSGIENGEFRFGSSGDTVLKEMIFLPDDDTLFSGDGIYTTADGAYYMNVDSGLMRNILYYGLFGLILLYGSFVFLTIWVAKNRRNYDYNSMLESVYIFLFIAFFITQIKGDEYISFFCLMFSLGIAQNLRHELDDIKYKDELLNIDN